MGQFCTNAYTSGFRQFLLRGLTKVRGEWAILFTAQDMFKLHKAA